MDLEELADYIDEDGDGEQDQRHDARDQHGRVEGDERHTRLQEQKASHRDQIEAQRHPEDDPLLGAVSERSDARQQVGLKRTDGNAAEEVRDEDPSDPW